MATSSTAQVLGKISQEHLECSICSNRFREPKALDCLHSFCLKCLQDLRTHKDPHSPKLACPLCRRETKLEGKQVSDLPSNFTLSALMEEFTIQEQVLESQQSQVPVICQACDDNNQAVSVCMDCAHFLCQECQAAHKRVKLTKSHKIFTMAQLQSGEITYKSKVREEVPKCSKHPDQNLSIYCSTCELLLCTTCSLLDHKSSEHSLSGLPEAVDKCKTDIEKLAAQAEKKKTEISTATEDTKKTHTKLDTTFADVKKKISTKANKEVAKKEEEIASIRQEEQKLQQEVEKTYRERVKIFETAEATNNNKVTQVEEELNQANQLMSEAICCDLLNFKQKLLFNLQEITRKQPEKVPDNLSFMDFEEGERSLGKLVLDAKPTVKPSQVVTKRSSKPTCRRWELQTNIQTFGPQKTMFKYADEIAAFSNHVIHAAVLDRLHQKIINFTMTRGKSKIHSQELQLPGLINPTHVDVNKIDQLIVLDSPQVMIFDWETQSLLHQFTPGRRFSTSKPTCLAVDEDNVIAVGYEAEEEVSLHDLDGICIERLPTPRISKNLTACKQRLIYTVPGMNKLCAVDYNGGTVFSVDIPSGIRGDWQPTGLCCDSNGDIYVGLYGGPIPGEIQHFSPTGEYIGCAIDGCGQPCDVSFTQGGDLVIAGQECVEIYKLTGSAN